MVRFIFIARLIYQELTDAKDQRPAKRCEKLPAKGTVVSYGEVARGRQGLLGDQRKSMRGQQAALRKQATELQLKRNSLEAELQHVEEDLDRVTHVPTGRREKVGGKNQPADVPTFADKGHLPLLQPLSVLGERNNQRSGQHGPFSAPGTPRGNQRQRQVWTAAVQAKGSWRGFKPTSTSTGRC